MYNGHDDVTLDVVQEDVAHQDGAGVDEHTRVRPGSERCRMSVEVIKLFCSYFTIIDPLTLVSEMSHDILMSVRLQSCNQNLQGVSLRGG